MVGRPIFEQSKPTVPVYCVAVDPSSTATGVAMFGFDGTLLMVGVTRGPGSRDYLVRTDRMCEDLCDELRRHQPHHAVIEMPGLHQGWGHEERMHGLARYGYAVGCITRTIQAWGLCGLHRVEPNTWTRSCPKAARAQRAMLEPVYHAWRETHDDTGGDGSDAVTLGGWFLAKCRKEALIAEHTQTRVPRYDHRCPSCRHVWGSDRDTCPCSVCQAPSRSVVLLPERKMRGVK